MCGGDTWTNEGWKPFADFEHDLAHAARRAATRAGADVDAPLVREKHEISVFPGVPLS
jgi:hypothetical protein